VKLTANSRPLPFELTDEGITVQLDESLPGTCPLALALTILGRFQVE
jgi:hypothetical protein